jgi:hypothetical protein
VLLLELLCKFVFSILRPREPNFTEGQVLELVLGLMESGNVIPVLMCHCEHVEPIVHRLPHVCEHFFDDACTV